MLTNDSPRAMMAVGGGRREFVSVCRPGMKAVSSRAAADASGANGQTTAGKDSCAILPALAFHPPRFAPAPPGRDCAVERNYVG